jgi:HEAT repeat protein
MPLIRKDPIGPTPADRRSSVETLRAGTIDERWRAARALGAVSGAPEPDAAHESEKGGSAATKALAEALEAETDLRVREAIFTSLVRIGSRECVDAVIPYVRVDDAALRTAALDALRAMIGAALPVLPGLLADPDADVRLLACDLVRELPAVDATRLLCDVLSREMEANVCAAAVDVLADIGEAEALPFLQSTAARFGDVTFLTFAVKIAMERIIAENSVRHE